MTIFDKKIFYLLFLALLLRLAGVLIWPFGFDQVQIMDNARAIVSGDFTLIGPRTGPASLFTGPLIYYLVAGFYVLGFGEWALVASTILTAAITGVVLLFLLRRYFDKKIVYWGVLLWAAATVLVHYDQVTWNPNLMLLAASLVVYPLLASTRVKLAKTDFLLLILGGFLSYQAHFAAFLFLPLSLLFIFSRYRSQILWGVVSVWMGLLLALLPTVLFDYRHDWANAKGLIAFGQQLSASASSTKSELVASLWKSFYTTFEGLGKIALSNFSLPVEASFLFGVAIFLIYIFYFSSQKKNIRELWVVVLWVVGSALLLAVYQGDKPPYYFLLQYPVFIYLYAKLLSWWSTHVSLTALIVVWLVAGILQAAVLFKQPGALSLFNLLRLRAYLVTTHSSNSLREIKTHLPVGEDFGVQYFLEDIQLNLQSGVIAYVAYPGDEVLFAQQRFGQLAVWLQEYKFNQVLYFTNEFRISTPDHLRLYRDNYQQSTARDKFIVLENGQIAAELSRLTQVDFVRLFPQLGLNVATNKWQWLEGSAMAVYQYGPSKELFILQGERAKELYADLAIF